jgi:hypothetical protein
MPAERVACPVCGKDVSVVKAGTFRNHALRTGGACPASGQTPAAAALLEPDAPPSPADVAPAEPERVSAELVPASSRAVTHTEHTESAIEAAAEAALLMPGVPGHAEFLTLAATARMLCLSGAAPTLVRGNPHLAFHIALVGRDLGISPTAALELIDVLDTRGGPRISLSPQLMNGQLRRLGLGAVRPIKRTLTEAIAGAYDPEGLLLGESEFTWQDAIIAGLADERCEANKHWRPNNGQGKCSCNQGYRAWPKRMLWWRAAGFCADDYFPEAGLGLYSPEALGAVVDEHGRPIDPSTIDLPDGYQPTGNGGTTRGLPAAEQPADGTELWLLQARAWALPDEGKRKLRERRQQTSTLRTEDGVIPFHQLPDRGLRVAKSLIAGLESQAARNGWDAEQALAEVLDRCARVHLGGMRCGVDAPEPAPEAEQAAEDPAPAGEAPGATQDPVGSDDDAALVTPEIIEWVKEQPLADVEQLLTDAQVEWQGRSAPDKRTMLALVEGRKRAQAG